MVYRRADDALRDVLPCVAHLQTTTTAVDRVAQKVSSIF